MASKKAVKQTKSEKSEVEAKPTTKKGSFSMKLQKSSETEESISDEDTDMDDVTVDEDADNEEEGEDEEDDDDEIGMEEGAPKTKKYSSEAFSDAMTRILASSLSGTDKKQPILARSKGVERKIEDEKLDYKARKILSAQKKQNKERGRVIPDFTTFEYEKRLRKVATRGVVKLFNAIRTQQKMTEVAVNNAVDTRKTKAAIDKAKNVSTMSKSSFLDLLKTGKN